MNICFRSKPSSFLTPDFSERARKKMGAQTQSAHPIEKHLEDASERTIFIIQQHHMMSVSGDSD